MTNYIRRFTLAATLAMGGAALAAGTPCLGLDGIGPLRAGMTPAEVRAAVAVKPVKDGPNPGCWYIDAARPLEGVRLMVIDGRVARIEIKLPTLRTFAGAHLGSTEQELAALYGARLDTQPHKYEPQGHTITLRSGAGDYGLRFETSAGKVTALQAGPWEHLNYVEGCS